MEIQKEFKLGVFILGGLLILVLGIFSIKDFKVLNPGYTIRVVFNFGDGLKSASPVRVAGIEAGEVKKVLLTNEREGRTKVIVYAWIKNNVKIPKNSEVFVNNLGILGEKYLEILPKENKEGYLEDGDILIGKDSIPMYKVGESAQEVVKRASSLLNSLEKIVKDKEVLSSFKRFVTNLEDLSLEAELLLKDIREKKGTIGKLIYEDTLYKKTEALLEELKSNPWKLLRKPRRQKEKKQKSNIIWGR